MNYRIWQAPPSDAAAQTALQAAGYGALFSRVLAARGVKTPQQAHSLLAEQAELSDRTGSRIWTKRSNASARPLKTRESIVIFGDYDVDGVSATAILYECLSNQGAHVRCKLPSRTAAVTASTRRPCAAWPPRAISSSSRWTTASPPWPKPIAPPNSVSTWSSPTTTCPAKRCPGPAAVVDPNRADDESPCKSLCGAGVAFKLCAALEDCAPGDLLEMFGELAALGTIADMMPLQGENRTIVQEGLAILQDTMRPGLQALLETAGYAHRPVTAETVSFGPRPAPQRGGPHGQRRRGPQAAFV